MNRFEGFIEKINYYYGTARDINGKVLKDVDIMRQNSINKFVAEMEQEVYKELLKFKPNDPKVKLKILELEKSISPKLVRDTIFKYGYLSHYMDAYKKSRKLRLVE